jgi:hypothetical protein
MHSPNRILFVAATALCSMAAVARGDERLEGIACRSVHLQYPAAEGTAFYNEVTVDQSARGTYFCVCGFHMGYYGIQELGDGRKIVLFSVWDPGSQNNPNAVAEEKRVKLLYKDDAVRIGRFGNEGTGGQCFFDYDWKVGETYRFLVTARADGERTAFSGWMFIPESKQWKRLVTFSTVAGGAGLRGCYSFVEDFQRNRVSATEARKAHFGNGWVRARDGRWVALARAQFTADSNPVTNIDAGVEGDRFFLATGGDTRNDHTPLRQMMDRQPSVKATPKDLPDDATTHTQQGIRNAMNETAVPTQDKIEIRVEPARASIGNATLRWEMSLADKQCRTVALVNRRTSETIPIEGRDFILEFADGRALSNQEFTVRDVREEPGERGGKRLVVTMNHDRLEVRLVTEIRPGEWWAARRLEITAATVDPSTATLALWRAKGARGPAVPGPVVESLGYPSGCGQIVYVGDLFLGIAHPGAENFASSDRLACRLPLYDKADPARMIVTRSLIVGAGESGGARPAFLRYIDATRAVPARMIFLANDWYWKDKSKPVEAIEALARIKSDTGVPIDSFTLDDGWDRDWDEASGLWGRLNRQRFPGGYPSLVAAGREANLRVSLWFGPIGGYGKRDERVAFGRARGYEVYGDKLCLAGRRYRRHAIEAFSHWAAQGMDYIKVDGFWPECREEDHGHAVGPAGAIAQMDALIEVFAAWHKARPNLVIGYTSGSNPSPFWLQHCDYVWRGGKDDEHAGAGEPFDRNNTYLDECLQKHRGTEMPISAFVTFDLVQHRVAGNSDAGFERGAWWLAARTSLHHDWYVQAQDLTLERWRLMAKVANWARRHEAAFRFSRMIGGDPGKGEAYGFAAFDGQSGTLALRNPSDQPRSIRGNLADWLDMPPAARARQYNLKGVYGATQKLEGAHAADALLQLELAPFEIAVFEVSS